MAAGADRSWGAPAARSAVQGALWDLAARRAGRPLADELAAGVGARGARCCDMCRQPLLGGELGSLREGAAAPVTRATVP